MSKEEEIKPEEKPNEEGEGQPAAETPEAKIERLEAMQKDHDELKAKHEALNVEKTQMGRRVRELSDSEKARDTEVAQMKYQIEQMGQPKEESDGFVDMTNPAVAKQWFNQQAREYVERENKEQTVYSRDYDKNIKNLIEENEDMSSEEKKEVMRILETQKDNIFDNPLQDAQYNIERAQGILYKNIARGNATVKNPNIRQEKAVGTGVGGGESPSETTKKQVKDSPEQAKMRESFETEKAMRGW